MGYLIFLAFIVGLDFFSKKYVKENFEIGQKEEYVKDKFYIWHIKNYGVAYNKFDRFTKEITLVSGAMIAALVGYFVFVVRASKSIIRNLGYMMLIGGAIGNFIDRANNKSVTDFIYYKKGRMPIFNIADVFILIGGVIIVIKEILKK